MPTGFRDLTLFISMLAFAMVMMSQFDLLINASMPSMCLFAERHMRYPFDFLSIVRSRTSKIEFRGGMQEFKMNIISPRMRIRRNRCFNLSFFIVLNLVIVYLNVSWTFVGSQDYSSYSLLASMAELIPDIWTESYPCMKNFRSVSSPKRLRWLPPFDERNSSQMAGQRAQFH